jgi:3-hydroxypropanoate dehydrogenase
VDLKLQHIDPGSGSTMSENMTDPLLSPAAKAAQQLASQLKQRVAPLDDSALDLLFREARSHNGWAQRAVSDELLQRLYDIVRWGSTSMNCCPARFVFIRTQESKQRLAPTLAPANVDKVLAAPVTVIIGHDRMFYRKMPELFPHREVASMFTDNPELCRTTAFRNGTLQGAYLILAARALGLDCGPMSGFDNEAVNDEFFRGTDIDSNFLCCLGYGDTSKIFQRLPRLEFSAACDMI